MNCITYGRKDGKKMDRILPWGKQILFIYEVPQIVAGANALTIVKRPSSRKPMIIRNKNAQMFRDHIHFGTREILGKLKKSDPDLADISFPLAGSECQLRVDVMFGFNTTGRGPARMIASDKDNLNKCVYDGLEGSLVDNDKWITEGNSAKGKAPPKAKGDVIVITASRAGFRDWEALEFLAKMPLLPPWRLQDHSKIILPGKS